MPLPPNTTPKMAEKPAAPFNEQQRREIACVALLGVMQGAKESGDDVADLSSDLDETGRRWTSVIGERMVVSPAIDKQDVGDAMMDAAVAEATLAKQGEESRAERQSRINICVDIMWADLAANPSGPSALPKPQGQPDGEN